MGHYDDSPRSSPICKRQRLSSPTYDEQLGDLSQDDLAAFDEIEYRLSQAQAPSPKRRRTEMPIGNSYKLDLMQSNASKDQVEESEHIADDPENPFSAAAGLNQLPVGAKPFVGFATASALPADAFSAKPDRDSSPPTDEAPPEQDFSAWFASADETLPEVASTSFSTGYLGFQSVTTDKKKGALLIPSAAALAKAKSKMQDWEKEETQVHETSTFLSADVQATASTPSRPQAVPPVLQSITSKRMPLQSIENTRSPAHALPLATFTSASNSISSPSGIRIGTKPFASPLVNKTNYSATPSVSSRLNPNNLNTPKLSSFSDAASIGSTPLSAAQLQRPSMGFSSPARTPLNLQKTIKKRATPAFKTPFKPGMRPGEPGRIMLSATKPTVNTSTYTPNSPAGHSSERECSEILTQTSPKIPEIRKVFDLTTRPDRTSLLDLKLYPGTYTRSQLEAKAINVTELSEITPATAKYYSFHSANTPACFSTQIIPSMGPKQAFHELLERGCNLVKQDWVDNHWGHILWKLAGMVALEPDREKTMERRWTYEEVMRQLLYRYEREINQGKRPALRLVTTQDAPAAYPMVLCVSNIYWAGGGVTDDGIPIEPHPTLEVSDGWYRMKARVDEPMARAARRGLLRIGRKLTVAGAWLSSEKKEPAEPLEAYHSTTLVLSGNSSHLAPWHAKLGFTPGPWISTMNSLTGDGGLVAVMDVVVVKVHKLGFLEFYVDEDGNKRSKSPVDEVGEAKAQQEWEKRRESETTRMHDEYQKKWYKYEGYLDRLERRAYAKNFRQSQDYAPTYAIESLYDDLEDPVKAAEICSTLDGAQAGWLAQHIKCQLEMEKGCIADRIREEVDETCPPRQVRSLRVLIVEDARTLRKPATRKAQLTVWDVLKLSLSEDSEMGEFKPGQRFLITNTLPTHQSAWMAPSDEGSEIYLRTTPNTRWTTLQA